MAKPRVRLQCDLDLESADRLKRIQVATGWSGPRSIEGALRVFEDGTLRKLTDDERARYMRCELSRDELVAANERWIGRQKKQRQIVEASPALAS